MLVYFTNYVSTFCAFLYIKHKKNICVYQRLQNLLRSGFCHSHVCYGKLCEYYSLIIIVFVFGVLFILSKNINTCRHCLKCQTLLVQKTGLRVVVMILFKCKHLPSLKLDSGQQSLIGTQTKKGYKKRIFVDLCVCPNFNSRVVMEINTFTSIEATSKIVNFHGHFILF